MTCECCPFKAVEAGGPCRATSRRHSVAVRGGHVNSLCSDVGLSHRVVCIGELFAPNQCACGDRSLGIVQAGHGCDDENAIADSAPVQAAAHRVVLAPLHAAAPAMRSAHATRMALDPQMSCTLPRGSAAPLWRRHASRAVACASTVLRLSDRTVVPRAPAIAQR
jgi:hypothetical protein